jgi:hypothetical protein
VNLHVQEILLMDRRKDYGGIDAGACSAYAHDRLPSQLAGVRCHERDLNADFGTLAEYSQSVRYKLQRVNALILQPE